MTVAMVYVVLKRLFLPYLHKGDLEVMQAECEPALAEARRVYEDEELAKAIDPHVSEDFLLDYACGFFLAYYKTIIVGEGGRGSLALSSLSQEDKLRHEALGL